MNGMGYLYLAIAILSEVIATSFLKFASGPRGTWWAYAIVGVGYVVSFVSLSLTLRAGLPLGIAYAIWAGIGVVAVAIISWLVFREALTWQQILGMALVAGGVALLELGGAKHPAT
jgi:small multidrug resistance pump